MGEEKFYTLTIKEAAKLIGVHRNTMAKWVKKMEIEHLAIGPTKILLNVDDVKAMVRVVKKYSDKKVFETGYIWLEVEGQYLCGICKTEIKRHFTHCRMCGFYINWKKRLNAKHKDEK